MNQKHLQEKTEMVGLGAMYFPRLFFTKRLFVMLKDQETPSQRRNETRSHVNRLTRPELVRNWLWASTSLKYEWWACYHFRFHIHANECSRFVLARHSIPQPQAPSTTDWPLKRHLLVRRVWLLYWFFSSMSSPCPPMSIHTVLNRTPVSALLVTRAKQGFPSDVSIHCYIAMNRFPGPPLTASFTLLLRYNITKYEWIFTPQK